MVAFEQRREERQLPYRSPYKLQKRNQHRENRKLPPISACNAPKLRYFPHSVFRQSRRDYIFMATANDIRKGMAIIYNGDVAVVLDTQHRTPGNLRAFVQATIRSIKTGKSTDVRFSSTEKVDVVPMMTRKMEFSYKDGE